MHRATNTLRAAALLTTLAFASTALAGCFSTYNLEQTEFAKLQRPDEVPLKVVAKDGTPLVIKRETNLYVRSVGGRRYPITPFNFKMTQSQLVASDRDTLLMQGEIDGYEVDLLSTWKTVTLISAGVLAAGGLIAFAVISAKPSN